MRVETIWPIWLTRSQCTDYMCDTSTPLDLHAHASSLLAGHICHISPVCHLGKVFSAPPAHLQSIGNAHLLSWVFPANHHSAETHIFHWYWRTVICQEVFLVYSFQSHPSYIIISSTWLFWSLGQEGNSSFLFGENLLPREKGCCLHLLNFVPSHHCICYALPSPAPLLTGELMAISHATSVCKCYTPESIFNSHQQASSSIKTLYIFMLLLDKVTAIISYS